MSYSNLLRYVTIGPDLFGAIKNAGINRAPTRGVYTYSGIRDILWLNRWRLVRPNRFL